MNKLLTAAGLAFVALILAACVDRAEIMPESSVTLFSAGRPVCSGVAIGGGYFLTAAHCTKRPLSLKRVIENDDPTKKEIFFDALEVMLSNKKYDVALLYLDGNKHQTSPLICRAPRVGERVMAITTPRGMEGIHSWGRVAGVSRGYNNRGTAWDEMTPLNLMAGNGSSGGPVYSANGAVLGLVVGGESPFGNFTYMVPATIICKVLGRPIIKI